MQVTVTEGQVRDAKRIRSAIHTVIPIWIESGRLEERERERHHSHFGIKTCPSLEMGQPLHAILGTQYTSSIINDKISKSNLKDDIKDPPSWRGCITLSQKCTLDQWSLVRTITSLSARDSKLRQLLKLDMKRIYTRKGFRNLIVIVSFESRLI